MDLRPSPVQQALQGSAREFAEVAPTLDWRARLGTFAHRILTGGVLSWGRRSEGGLVGATLVLEELAAAEASTALGVLHQFLLVAGLIEADGTEAQKERWLGGLARGEEIGAAYLRRGWSVAERPRGERSEQSEERERNVRKKDAWENQRRYSTSVTANRSASGWLLDGTTSPAPLGTPASVSLILAKEGVEAEATTGANERPDAVFLVPAGARGSRVEPWASVGLKGTEMARVIFEHCEVPDDCRLGAEGRGRNSIEALAESYTVGIAAIGLGLARAGLECTLRQLGAAAAHLGERHSIGFRLADAATELDAARLLTQRAAARIDAGDGAQSPWRLAGLQSMRAAVRACGLPADILDEMALHSDGNAQVLLLDARQLAHFAGSDDSQRLGISDDLLHA